jgi:hypothetical protein
MPSSREEKPESPGTAPRDRPVVSSLYRHRTNGIYVDAQGLPNGSVLLLSPPGNRRPGSVLVTSEEFANLYEPVAPKCVDCAEGHHPMWLDEDGTRITVSHRPAAGLYHASSEFWWPCPLRVGERNYVESAKSVPHASVSDVKRPDDPQDLQGSSSSSVATRAQETPRCEGRYPVPGPRSEPFEVTYRCGQRVGHAGAHGPEEVAALCGREERQT